MFTYLSDYLLFSENRPGAPAIRHCDPIDGMQIEWNEFHFISLVMNKAIIFIFYFEFLFHLSYRNVIWLDLPLAFPTFMYLTVYWLCHRFGPLPYRIRDDFCAVLCNVRYRRSSYAIMYRFVVHTNKID